MAWGRKLKKRRKSLHKNFESDKRSSDIGDTFPGANEPANDSEASGFSYSDELSNGNGKYGTESETESTAETSLQQDQTTVDGYSNNKLDENARYRTQPKRRKIHLNSLDCMSLSQCESGTKALSKPFEIPRSSRNPHQGLQPRLGRKTRLSKIRHGNDDIQNDDNGGGQASHDSAIGKHYQNEIVGPRNSEEQTKFQRLIDANSNAVPLIGTHGKGFTPASSLITHVNEKEIADTDLSHCSEVVKTENHFQGGFKSASSLVGLTESQIEVGGFQSSNSVVEKTFKRINSKLKKAKETAGPFQKNISNFFTKTVVKSTSPRKDTMAHFQSSPSSSQEKVRSVMYSPVKQVSGSIYISDSSSPEQTPKKSQNSSNTKSHQQHGENSTVKKLFDGQKNLAAGLSLPKKRKPTTSQSFPNNQKASTSTSETPSFQSINQSSSTSQGSSRSESVTRNIDEVIYQQTYGLVGEGSSLSFSDPQSPEVTVNYFEIVPLHIIQHIFCQLPILDLCLNGNRVCRQWNDIISDEKFVPWKKKYHQLKASHGNVYAQIQDIMNKCHMVLPSKYLKALIRYMKDFKPVTALNMTECLKKHPKYDWADALVKERIPECIENEEVNPWSLITTLVIISDSVADIQAILKCLTVSCSQCTSMEIMECLYCVASFLYAFRLKAGPEIWSGMHYRVYYALYLYENNSVSNHGMLQEAMSSSSCGQQTMVKYSRGDTAVRLTHEQMRIIKHSPNPGNVVKIVAFAGTGKTTTLVRYTQMRPNKKFLLVVYNKSVSQHAEKTFPKNVTCKTGHALAFGVIGRRYTYGGKLRNLKVYDITQVLPPRKGDNLYVRATFVMETINTYCGSDNDNISSVHVPETRKDDMGNRISIDHVAKMRYVEDAEYLWARMKDIQDQRIGMTHDGYLKLYQLSRPQLPQYDVILIDEAQDLTPAVIDILKNQHQAKILVGDPHQQIYSFRGAVNAMSLISASHTFYLTQSFRFGPEIAQVAASCLEVLKDVKEKTIVGHGIPGHCRGERVGQIAFICRSNFTVFSEAVRKCCYNEDKKVAFVGGTTAFGFPMIMDIYTLMLSEEDRKKDNRKIQNKLISKFSDLASLEKYANKVMDNELLGKIKIVRTYHHNTPIHVNTILSKCVSDCARADYVFSTAHKAKGLEFSTVFVTDDYINLHGTGLNIIAHGFKDVMNAIQIPADETNLLYVAVTRAKRALLMSPTLLRLLQDNGEKFEYPVSSSQLEKSCVPFKCMQTDAEFKPRALTLRKLQISLADSDPKPGGLYSPVVLSEDFHRFAELLGDPDVKPVPKQQPRHRIILVDAEDDDEDYMMIMPMFNF